VTSRNGADWWARLPERLAELTTLVPGIAVAGLGIWVLFGVV
jgi:hypothetical protein